MDNLPNLSKKVRVLKLWNPFVCSILTFRPLRHNLLGRGFRRELSRTDRVTVVFKNYTKTVPKNQGTVKPPADRVGYSTAFS
jgi:hypothetical protein